MLDYVLLIIGFLFLIKGANLFVDGSASVAKKLRVPTLIIGMTIVAMGTSAPECAVSIAAAINGSNSMAISNVVGSNIFNLMVVCGACALFKPLTVKSSTLRIELPFSILVGVLLFALGYFGMVIGRVDGVILMVLFLAFLLWMVLSAMKGRTKIDENEGDGEVKILPVWKCILFIIIGLVAIVIGGDLVVDSASVIALRFHISETIIGLTIVAFGTSLPELITSLVAAKKGQADMALGNVIGSNIFNILLVLGLAAVINPMAVMMENLWDMVLLTVMSLMAFLFAWRSQSINRWEGITMLGMYGAYVIYICIR